MNSLMSPLDNYHYLMLLIANSVHRAPHPINIVGARYLSQSLREIFTTVDDGALSLKTVARRVGCADNESRDEDEDNLIII